MVAKFCQTLQAHRPCRATGNAGSAGFRLSVLTVAPKAEKVGHHARVLGDLLHRPRVPGCNTLIDRKDGFIFKNVKNNNITVDIS